MFVCVSKTISGTKVLLFLHMCKFFDKKNHTFICIFAKFVVPLQPKYLLNI